MTGEAQMNGAERWKRHSLMCTPAWMIHRKREAQTSGKQDFEMIVKTCITFNNVWFIFIVNKVHLELWSKIRFTNPRIGKKCEWRVEVDSTIVNIVPRSRLYFTLLDKKTCHPFSQFNNCQQAHIKLQKKLRRITPFKIGLLHRASLKVGLWFPRSTSDHLTVIVGADKVA